MQTNHEIHDIDQDAVDSVSSIIVLWLLNEYQFAILIMA